MRYEKARFETFDDFRRSMVRVLVLVYLVALSGIVLKWHLEGGSLWPYLAAALIAGPCMALGYFLGIPRARYLFEAGRRKMRLAERK